MVLTRENCEALDGADTLAGFRHRFDLPVGKIYLDGNSLGAPPIAARQRVDRAFAQWRNDLNASWWKHGWLDLPRQLGDKLARIVGANSGEVIVADSTSVNLFKLLLGATQLRHDRRVILTDAGNFPGDLYVAQGIAQAQQRKLRIVPAKELIESIDRDTAVVMLSQVDFRSGQLTELKPVVARAHAMGALVLVDLAHSAGVLPLRLSDDGVDLAVGCGYKFLNGGPGAPAFLYVAKPLLESFANPIWGWIGHRDAFAFESEYRPAPSIASFQVGCPPLLSLIALDAGVDLVLEADLQAVRRKSAALTGAFIDSVSPQCAANRIEIVTPFESHRRGSHVSLRHPQASRLADGLADHGVIAEFRAPDLVRFGFAPLYISFRDLWGATEILKRVLREIEAPRRAHAPAGLVTDIAQRSGP